MNRKIIIISSSIFLISPPTYSYIGPGMAGGVIAGILGFILAIILTIITIIYYPIKRYFKNRNKIDIGHK